MSSANLHPNLAKLAAAYDDVLRRAEAGQITAQQAQGEIAQLEARDDQGVRWGIDGRTGEWVRKTAFGDSEYDASPPQSGYMTLDPFDYSADSTPQVFNPADMVELSEAPDMLGRPEHLLGATRALPGDRRRLADRSALQGDDDSALERFRQQVEAVVDRVWAWSPRTKVIAAALVVALLAFVLYSPSSGSTGSGGSQLPVLPSTSASQPAPPGVPETGTQPAPARSTATASKTKTKAQTKAERTKAAKKAAAKKATAKKKARERAQARAKARVKTKAK